MVLAILTRFLQLVGACSYCWIGPLLQYFTKFGWLLPRVNFQLFCTFWDSTEYIFFEKGSYETRITWWSRLELFWKKIVLWRADWIIKKRATWRGKRTGSCLKLTSWSRTRAGRLPAPLSFCKGGIPLIKGVPAYKHRAARLLAQPGASTKG